jgi:hypothetical protein
MDPRERFNRISKYLESSGGKNLSHEPITSGPNAGQTAGGESGILPETLKDIVKQSKMKGLPVDPSLQGLVKQPNEDITKSLTEDRSADEKAQSLAKDFVMNKAGDNEPKAAYLWRTGHNQDINKVPTEKITSHPYVKEYINQMRETDPNAAIVDPEKMSNTVPYPEQTNWDKLKTLFGK